LLPSRLPRPSTPLRPSTPASLTSSVHPLPFPLLPSPSPRSPIRRSRWCKYRIQLLRPLVCSLLTRDAFPPFLLEQRGPEERLLSEFPSFLFLVCFPPVPLLRVLTRSTLSSFRVATSVFSRAEPPPTCVAFPPLFDATKLCANLVFAPLPLRRHLRRVLQVLETLQEGVSTTSYTWTVDVPAGTSVRHRSAFLL
jgi:hypothetical protein